MASAATLEKWTCEGAAYMFDHDPGTTAATVVSGDGGTTKHYLALGSKRYNHIVVGCMNTVSASASGPTLVEIIGATDSSGTNAAAIVTSGTIASVTVGDTIWVECSAAQVNEVGRAAGFGFTHVTARVTCSNAGDECCVFIRLQDGSMERALTANVIQ